ncbi:CHAP domain-containing protein [Dictyobacter aurantiacus]|nr:CHAP domain-containing protein [Dictyobacter aurantiacus]
MLFRDRSRNADTEQHQGVTPPASNGGGAPSMLMEQGGVPVPNTPMAAPGDAQAPLVPMPLDAGAMPGIAPRTTDPLREVVFIPSTGKKSTGTLRPPRGRRTVVHIGVAVALIVIVIGAFAAVLPTSNGQASSTLTKIFNPGSDTKTSQGNNTALIAAQAATATAVTQDGFDAGNQVYAGVQAAPTVTTNIIPAQDQGSLNRFFYGQCTYWANMRYHQLTGHWVPWLGNAYQWAYQAPAYGWKTSSVPNPYGPSIIVLAPYTEGAGAYGHVAVVETGVSNPYNGVSTSNWNWNGNWATTTYWTFYPGSGVTFIWFPG